jgi:hypothetical protein
MNKFFTLLIAIVFISTNIIAQPTATAPSGSGTIGSPYQISSVENLYWISQNSSSWNKYFEQTGDLDLGSYSDWPVIGNSTTKFIGSYDGQNHTIGNLTINKPSTDDVGLFGHVGYPATIKNLGLINVDIKGARGTGSLVGRVIGDINTTIQYCFVEGGTVLGDGATGGLVGANNSNVATAAGAVGHRPRVLNCYSNVDVIWSRSGVGDKIGGLVGCNQKGRIENSFARGSVTVNNDPDAADPDPDRVGGLTGCSDLKGVILDSYSTTLVETFGSVTNVGGFVGNIGSSSEKGTVTDSYWDTQTSGQTTSAGGTGYTTSEMQDPATFSAWTSTLWSFTSGQYPQLYQSDGATILPVDLIAFKAKVENENLYVMWKTASEVNNKHFEIQVSENGIDFETISITKGAGDSKSTNTRLKQLDFDGAFKIYGPIDIRSNKSAENIIAMVYPIPAENRLIIKLSARLTETTFISIYDLSGKEVLSTKLDFNETEFSIDISELSSGIYYLKSTSNKTINRKIVINK